MICPEGYSLYRSIGGGGGRPKGISLVYVDKKAGKSVVSVVKIPQRSGFVFFSYFKHSSYKDAKF